MRIGFNTSEGQYTKLEGSEKLRNSVRLGGWGPKIKLNTGNKELDTLSINKSSLCNFLKSCKVDGERVQLRGKKFLFLEFPPKEKEIQNVFNKVFGLVKDDGENKTIGEMDLEAKFAFIAKDKMYKKMQSAWNNITAVQQKNHLKDYELDASIHLQTIELAKKLKEDLSGLREPGAPPDVQKEEEIIKTLVEELPQTVNDKFKTYLLDLFQPMVLIDSICDEVQKDLSGSIESLWRAGSGSDDIVKAAFKSREARDELESIDAVVDLENNFIKFLNQLPHNDEIKTSFINGKEVWLDDEQKENAEKAAKKLRDSLTAKIGEDSSLGFLMKRLVSTLSTSKQEGVDPKMTREEAKTRVVNQCVLRLINPQLTDRSKAALDQGQITSKQQKVANAYVGVIMSSFR